MHNLPAKSLRSILKGPIFRDGARQNVASCPRQAKYISKWATGKSFRSISANNTSACFRRSTGMIAPILSHTKTMSSSSATTRSISVAVVGVGLVGGEFINQLLAFPQPSPFRIVSISSSKTHFFHPDGLSIANDNWKSELASATNKLDFQGLVRELAGVVAPGQKVVLVDNTSSEDVAALYPTILKFGIDIITPNKKAYSGTLQLYENILSAGLESGARFLNEATVGAGLPIISTLKDLVATGDKVRGVRL